MESPRFHLSCLFWLFFFFFLSCTFSALIKLCSYFQWELAPLSKQSGHVTICICQSVGTMQWHELKGNVSLLCEGSAVSSVLSEGAALTALETSKVCKDGNTVQVCDFTTSAACPEHLKIALEIVIFFTGQFSDGMLKGVVVPPLSPCDYNMVPCGH